MAKDRLSPRIIAGLRPNAVNIGLGSRTYDRSVFWLPRWIGRLARLFRVRLVDRALCQPLALVRPVAVVIGFTGWPLALAIFSSHLIPPLALCTVNRRYAGELSPLGSIRMEWGAAR